MHAPLKAFFLLVLCAGVGLVLTGGRISTPQPASIRMPILPPEWTAPDEPVSDVAHQFDAQYYVQLDSGQCQRHQQCGRKWYG